MSGLTYQETYTIPFFQTDVTKHLTISAMVDLMTLVSEHQLDSLGIGETVMHELGVGWVVTQYHIDITRLPEVNEKVNIFTTAESYNRFFCYRRFWIEDLDGNLLTEVKSTFVMMSFETRKMVPVIESVLNKLEAPFEKALKRFPRVAHLDSEVETTSKKYQVRYFDIDSNLHVNNVHYFDWMLDTFSKDFLLNHQIKTIDLRYEREIQYGEIAHSEAQWLPEVKQSRHQISSNDEVNTEAMIQWH